MSGIFPAGFEDLEPYTSWALPTEAARYTKRYNSPMKEVQAFYDVMVNRVSDALQYLNQRPLDDLRPDEKRLLNLCLSLVEAAVAVEMFKQPDPPYLMPMTRFQPVHDTW